MKTNTIRYFLTYRGVKLPLCLTEELPATALQHRNTYFRAAFDEQARLVWLEKLVYGEVEMRHEYEYDPHGALLTARIQMGDEAPTVLSFAV